MLDYFGLKDGSKQVVGANGEKEDEEQPGDEEELHGKEATEFRGCGRPGKLSVFRLPGFAVSG